MSVIAEQEYVELFPIADLKPHPDNPRVHDDEAMDESIEATGFSGAVLVQKSSNYILDGHGRVKALQRKGETTVPAFVIDCDDATAVKILLSRNRVGDKSGYDEDILAGLLGSLAEDGDLYGTAYSPDDLDELLRSETPEEEFEGGYVEDEDEAKHRGERVAKTKASVGLREVVLVYRDEDYEKLKQAVAVISDFASATSTSEAVLAGMVQYATVIEAEAKE